MLLLGFGPMGMIYLLTLYLQHILGYSPIWTALAFLPFGAGIILGAGISSKLVERLAPRPVNVISARAFAPLPRLLALATGLSTAKTVWLLPKGRNAASELEALDPSWQGDFRLEPSLTDPDAAIIVAGYYIGFLLRFDGDIPAGHVDGLGGGLGSGLRSGTLGRSFGGRGRGLSPLRT